MRKTRAYGWGLKDDKDEEISLHVLTLDLKPRVWPALLSACSVFGGDSGAVGVSGGRDQGMMEYVVMFTDKHTDDRVACECPYRLFARLFTPLSTGSGTCPRLVRDLGET